MAESIGFEPMRPFLNDGLANRCLNHSANSPGYSYVAGGLRTPKDSWTISWNPDPTPYYEYGGSFAYLRYGYIVIIALKKYVVKSDWPGLQELNPQLLFRRQR